MFVQCVPPILFAPRISRTNVAPSSKHDPICAMSFQSVFCVFLLTLEQARSNLCHVGSVCSSHLGGTTLGQTCHPRASTTHFLPSTFCLFFLHLCHVFSVCSSHLVCATHFADKRGPLELARTSLYHACETGGVSWQLARFWKLASDKSLGEKLKICSL